MPRRHEVPPMMMLLLREPGLIIPQAVWVVSASSFNILVADGHATSRMTSGTRKLLVVEGGTCRGEVKSGHE